MSEGMTNEALLKRITRDITDGLIVLNTHGNISFINPAAKRLLEVEDVEENVNYATAFSDDLKAENDNFFQFLVTAVYENDKTHTGTVNYTTRKNNIKWFDMATSFLFSEDGKNKEGVVIQFSDVTDVHMLRQKTKDSASVFVVLMSAVCLWALACVAWEFLGEPISSSTMTIVVEVFGFLVSYLLLKNTSITIKDMGLSTIGIKKYLLIDSLFTFGITAVAFLIKIVLLKVKPGLFANPVILDFSFFDWSCCIYPITVVVQEFLTRGVVHESVKRIMPGKHSDFWAILTSSLFFGALHIHKGLFYMIGAIALLSVFGIVYRKQKTIWGLCIPHYVLGFFFPLLFGF